MSKTKHKKKGLSAFGLEALIAVGIVVFIVGMVLALTAQSLTTIQATFTAGSLADNITQDAMAATQTVSSNMGLLVTVGIMAIIISVLLGVYAIYQGRKNK